MPRRDIAAKVNGTAQYAIDVKLPGMVYASTLHSPVHDDLDRHRTAAPPESWNDAEVKAMKGVIAIVKLPTASRSSPNISSRRRPARDALKVTWSKGKADGFNSVQALEGYVKIHDDPNAQATTLEKKGDVAAAFASAAKTYKTRSAATTAITPRWSR